MTKEIFKCGSKCFVWEDTDKHEEKLQERNATRTLVIYYTLSRLGVLDKWPKSWVNLFMNIQRKKITLSYRNTNWNLWGNTSTIIEYKINIPWGYYNIVGKSN